MTSVGHANRSEDVAHVELHRRAERRQRGTRAQAPAHVPDEPVEEAVVVGDFRRPLACQALEVASLPPAGADFSEAFPPFLLGRGPRVVGRTDSLQPRVEEDEAGTAFRVGRREEHADAGTVAPVQSTARSDPTASMTARMSSIVVSSDCTSRTRSDRPVPRLSSMSTRPESASPSTWRTRRGWSQVETRSPAMPRMNTTRARRHRRPDTRSRRRRFVRSARLGVAQRKSL